MLDDVQTSRRTCSRRPSVHGAKCPGRSDAGSASASCSATAPASPLSTTAAFSMSRWEGSVSTRRNLTPAAHLGASPKCSCQLSLQGSEMGVNRPPAQGCDVFLHTMCLAATDGCCSGGWRAGA